MGLPRCWVLEVSSLCIVVESDIRSGLCRIRWRLKTNWLVSVAWGLRNSWGYMSGSKTIWAPLVGLKGSGSKVKGLRSPEDCRFCRRHVLGFRV